MATFQQLENLFNTFLHSPSGKLQPRAIVRGSVSHSVVAFGGWEMDGDIVHLDEPEVHRNKHKETYHVRIPGPHVDMMWNELDTPEITFETAREGFNIGFGPEARIKIHVITHGMSSSKQSALINDLKRDGNRKIYEKSSVEHIATPGQRKFFQTLIDSKRSLEISSASDKGLVVKAIGKWGFATEIFPAKNVYQLLTKDTYVDIIRLYEITDIRAQIDNPLDFTQAIFKTDGGPRKNEPMLELKNSKGENLAVLFNPDGCQKPHEFAIRKAVDIFNSANRG